MFLFTKSRKNTESDYRRLEDIETRDQFLSPTEKFSPNQDGLNYRAAFYGVSTFYILTLILGSLLWRFGSNITAVPSRIDIPRDQMVLFQKVDEFEAKSSGKTADDPWASLIPTGKGFVQIDSQNYCISMFHQLHCIATLKTAFEANDTSNPHMAHCFDYLRQGVMCAGDMTLEPVLDLGDVTVQAVDGWGVEHRCRSFEAMKGWAEGRRFLNSTGIH